MKVVRSTRQAVLLVVGVVTAFAIGLGGRTLLSRKIFGFPPEPSKPKECHDTVKTHIKRIFKKLAVRSRTQAVVKLLQG